jgi:hypothetical protein
MKVNLSAFIFRFAPRHALGYVLDIVGGEGRAAEEAKGNWRWMAPGEMHFTH